MIHTHSILGSCLPEAFLISDIFQWSMFKINELETLDTAFYRCEASNAFESVHSDAIVQVAQLTKI